MTNLFAKNRKYIFKKLIDHEVKIDSQKEISDNIILVDISNINYWYHNTDNKETDANKILKNIENLPWPFVWFEFSTASISDGEILNDNFLLRTFSDLVSGVLAIEEEAETHLLFFMGNNDFGIKCFGRITYYKSIFKNFDMYMDQEMMNTPLDKTTNMERTAQSIGMMLKTVLYSIIFCHCKNVEYTEKKHSKSLQKSNIKRGKVPQETYKVLDIEGLKKKIVSKSNNDDPDSNTALHVCRGHFRDYTEDSPLFGKYVGKVWVPMHMRGDKNNGKVNKDYKVNV